MDLPPTLKENIQNLESEIITLCEKRQNEMIEGDLSAALKTGNEIFSKKEIVVTLTKEQNLRHINDIIKQLKKDPMT